MSHAKPRGGNITSKRKDMLANQKFEEKRKRPITGERGWNVWINIEVELFVSIKLEYDVNKTHRKAI